jgi:signal peptidase II
MRPTNLIAGATGIAVLVLVTDQAAKLLARHSLAVCAGPPASACDQVVVAGALRLIRVENAGSALGFAQGFWVWALIAALGLALLPLYGRRLAGAGWLAPLAIGLQAGGALGNLIDRAMFGGVTDFIDAGIGIVFNPADVALLAGRVLAFEAMRRSGRALPEEDTARSQRFVSARESCGRPPQPMLESKTPPGGQ